MTYLYIIYWRSSVVLGAVWWLLRASGLVHLAECMIRTSSNSQTDKAHVWRSVGACSNKISSEFPRFSIVSGLSRLSWRNAFVNSWKNVCPGCCTSRMKSRSCADHWRTPWKKKWKVSDAVRCGACQKEMIQRWTFNLKHKLRTKFRSQNKKRFLIHSLKGPVCKI